MEEERRESTWVLDKSTKGEREIHGWPGHCVLSLTWPAAELDPREPKMKHLFACHDYICQRQQLLLHQKDKGAHCPPGGFSRRSVMKIYPESAPVIDRILNRTPNSFGKNKQTTSRRRTTTVRYLPQTELLFCLPPPFPVGYLSTPWRWKKLLSWLISIKRNEHNKFSSGGFQP